MNRDTLLGIGIIAAFIIASFISIQPRGEQDAAVTSSNRLFQKNGIAVVDIFGGIAFSQAPSYFGPVGADSVLKQLNSIKKNKHVKGLIVRVNSPGGTVGASQEIYRTIQDVKKELNIPVVAQIGDVGASGGYYAALGADTIFANPGSLVGSIGVILGNLDIQELAKKHGVDMQVYKSGPYKDLLSMWRPSSEQEKAMLQDLVDDVYLQFETAFIESRKISKRSAKKLAQGQIYTGKQALKHDMIDKLGGYNDAITYIGELTGLGTDPHIISTKERDWAGVVNMINSALTMKWPVEASLMPELR